MNQIKQKIEEIGLSQREISKRLGKNDSYLAGVFRTGLSTAKQAELLELLDIVGGGGTVQSDDEIIAELSQKLADCQNAGIKALESYGIVQNQLNCANNNHADVRGKFLDQCNKERWKYQDKYAYHFKLNLLLICMIVIGLILWVLI